jgi:hypothetical protein
MTKRTVIDAFNHTSYYPAEPKVGFGTGSRPPLNEPTAGPGPGAYTIKTTLGKLLESHIQSPCQYTIRGRTKFGDPNERSMSKTCANEPGYDHIILIEIFLLVNLSCYVFQAWTI